MRRILEEIKDKKLLWDVLDALSLPAFLVDPEFNITGINGSVEDRLSFARKDLAGTPLFDIVKAYPSKKELYSNNFVTADGQCLKKDRESFPARITFVRHLEGFIVVIEDRSDIQKLAYRAALRGREISTYSALTSALSRGSDLKEMMKEVLKVLVKVTDIDAAWLYLADEKEKALSLCCFEGVEESIFEGAKELCSYECLIGRVLSSGRALLVKNSAEDPRITHIKIKESGVKSIAAVPLLLKEIGEERGKVVGVLGAASREEGRFSSYDMQFFSAVGNQLGVAVENMRLIEKLREKMREIELINEISNVVNSSLSIGHIFRIAVAEVKKMIDFDRASITLLNESKNSMNIFALDTGLQTKLPKGTKAPLEGTSSGWVTANQKPWINKDLSRETVFEKDGRLREEGIRSTISVPLFKDKPLGSLNFDSVHPGKYSEKDLEILMQVARHLSIALENALLFEEISREKREWEKTFDSITDMVWIEDLKGNILRTNRAVSDKTGLPEAHLLQKTSEEIYKSLKIKPEDLYPLEIHPLERGGGKWANAGRRYRELSGGGNIYLHWTYPLMDSEGNAYGTVNSLKDMTEQKRLEQQLFRANKLASLGTLVAGIAHEINNPLGIIAGYSEALRDRAGDPELQKVPSFEDFPEYLETINREIFRCKDILKGLLDFSRPSTGTFREIDINELIKEVILLVKHSAKKQNQRIVLDLDRNIPRTAADPGGLRQLFMNIIMNSFYFIGAEGTISIRTRGLSDPYGGSFIQITISDNGKGIEGEDLERVFDPFFTTKPAGEGTGLGLSVCHRIVSEHDGTIDVKSRPGEGTTFLIRLPVKDIAHMRGKQA